MGEECRRVRRARDGCLSYGWARVDVVIGVVQFHERMQVLKLATAFCMASDISNRRDVVDLLLPQVSRGHVCSMFL